MAALRADGPWRPRTLGGCVLAAVPGRPGLLRVTREPAAWPAGVPAAPGVDGRWDRFAVALAAVPGGAGDLSWGPLGDDASGLAAGSLPAEIAQALPALRQGGRVVAVPHLGWHAAGWEGAGAAARFAPPSALLR
jgi:hypothetical protein